MGIGRLSDSWVKERLRERCLGSVGPEIQSAMMLYQLHSCWTLSAGNVKVPAHHERSVCLLPVSHFVCNSHRTMSSFSSLLAHRQVPASLQQGHPKELSREGQGISIKFVLDQ